jgi:hypothetical protein
MPAMENSVVGWESASAGGRRLGLLRSAASHRMKIQIDDLTIETGPGARQQALDLANSCYREREKTRRLFFAAGSVFFVVSALIMVFAPADRMGLAYICGAVLIVLALGSIGVAKFRLKMPGVELDTKDDSE